MIELLVNDAVWVCFVVAVAMINGNGFNKRVAGGMFLASIPLEIAMVLFGVVPLIEWAIAIWGGVVLFWLAQNARKNV